MRPRRLNTRQIIKRFYRSWWKRPFWLLAVLVVPLVVGRIALTPLAQGAIRQHLDRTQGAGVISFSDLDIFLFPLSFTFHDVAIHAPQAGTGDAPGGGNPSGDSLSIDRLEVHVASVQELVASVPHIRLRMVRPRLQLRPGSYDLERVARALPTARVDVTSVESGQVSQLGSQLGGQIGQVGVQGGVQVGVIGGGSDGRPMVDGVSGDIEGMATGSEVGRGGWQIWSDGRLLERDPIHVLVKLEPSRAWQATVTLQEIPAVSSAASNVPISIDARIRGTAAHIQAKVHAGWGAGEGAPPLVAEEMLRALPETWPGRSLSLVTLKAGPASVGQAVDLVAETEATGTAPAGSFHAFDLLGVLVGTLRLANQAVLPQPAGMATLTETDQTAAAAEQAAP